jgi:hypothetical protein
MPFALNPPECTMYNKLDVSPTMPLPRDARRAAMTGLDALPDELIGDIPRPAADPAPARWTPHAAAWRLACVPLLCLFGLLLGYLGYTG